MSGYYKNSGLTFFFLMKDRQIFKRIHVLFLKTGPHRIMSTDGKMDDKMDGKMDGQTDKVIPLFPPIQNFVFERYKN